jgi:hypothetical protein
MDDFDDSVWQRKGATLSDKTARKEYGLTQVEALVKKKHGGDYLQGQQARTELAGINRELKKFKKQIAALEERKSKLLTDLGR